MPASSGIGTGCGPALTMSTTVEPGGASVPGAGCVVITVLAGLSGSARKVTSGWKPAATRRGLRLLGR